MVTVKKRHTRRFFSKQWLRVLSVVSALSLPVTPLLARDRVADNRLLTPTQVGSFVYGDRIDAGKLPTGDIIKKRRITHMEEGEKITLYEFDVWQNGVKALLISGGYDHRTNTPTQTITETKVLSSDYKTTEGVGVGSTLVKAMATYPRSKLMYSYVCDCIWLENGLYGIQFHIAKGNYKKPVPTHADSVQLQAADFKPNTRISHVRIFGETSHSYSIKDFLGRYTNKTGHLAVISQQAGNTTLRWKTGSDIYLDNTYDMVLNQDELVSHPLEKADISLSVKQLKSKQFKSKRLALFVDDNPEFEPFKTELTPSANTSNVNNLSHAQKIQHVRAVYKEVTDNLSIYQKKTHTSHEPKTSTEGAKTTLYTQNGQYRKIVKTFYGEMGKRRMAYYFDKQGGLSFVLDTTTHYNVPMYMTKTYMTKADDGMEAFDPKKSTIIENRHYFYAERMIRWLDSKNKHVSHKSPRFQKKAQELLAVHQAYQ